MEGYRFSTEISVRFAETDAQGIAHHASFLVWCEVARIEWLALHAGGYRRIQERGIEAVKTEAHLRYRRAAAFDDRLRVWARCVDVRGARFRYEYAIERDGDTIADGWTGHACVSADTLRPTRMPTWLAEAIAEVEG